MKIGSRGCYRCMVRTHEAVGALMFTKAKLSNNACKELIEAAWDIADQSLNPEGRITLQKFKEILSQVFVGQTCVL
ncbi:hypothetical protein SORBI_3001G337300 [Sorghum bicolor]|uniref:EF-hand domain-containing protein n=1 Tax=Sorghum bicolor TaxID=4558 RepID=A0A1B6QMJ2_SORBI|nr:hypothetical protein SORBI_3001G337300 [Sorghum bicolor]OQU92394.1 hypothetical protein SORBI_3001G337300 [Sorghum bicolor]